MKITFLGTGTSQGVPFIGCKCEVCLSVDAKDKRLRSSIWIQTDNATSIMVDTGPDFRYQALRTPIPDVDAIIYTHGHKDHVAGLDDIKAYNYWFNKAIDVYANEETTEVLKREFQYIFADFKYPGIPELNLHLLNGQPFSINGNELIPIKVLHYKLEVYGYRIGDFTYITDANFISDEEKEKVKGSKVLVLNALRREKHISHFTLEEAIALAKDIGAEQTYFTHISHQLGLHQAVNLELPSNMQLAYDGLTLDI